MYLFLFTELIEINANQLSFLQSTPELRVIHKHDYHDTHNI